MEITNGFHMHIFNMADSENAEVEELESWEDLTDEILDRNLTKMKALAASEKQHVDQKPGTVVFDSSDIRSRFLSHQSEPTVKILKRPQTTGAATVARGHGSHAASAAAGDGLMACVNGDARAKPRKSLQQRELEYAEARLRILGQAQSPEEKEPTFQERVRQIQNKSTSPSSGANNNGSTSTTADIHHPSTTNHHIITSTLSPQSPIFISHNHNFATGCTTILTSPPPHFADTTIYTNSNSTASPYYASAAAILPSIGGVLAPTPVGSAVLAPSKFAPTPNQHHVFNHVRSAQAQNVVRQPRGPDGTRGFQFHQPR